MGGGGFAPYGDLYGEAPPKSGAFFALAVYELDLLFLNKIVPSLIFFPQIQPTTIQSVPE